jgi:hypothetical protein
MTPVVETFEDSEVAAECIEASEEAVQLLESLGAVAQLALVTKAKDSPRQSRMPYREMTAEERFVYGVLCPTKSNIEDYNASPIPLRVLQVAAHAKQTGMFKRLVIWDRESVTVKDPVLVGCTEGEFAWRGKDFILARWGEELEAFAVLAKRATTIWRERAIESIDSITASVAAHRAAITSLTLKQMIERGPDFVPELRV